jgi:hypothetical protein
MGKQLVFVFALSLVYCSTWAASRSIITPGSGPALILLEEVDYSTGELDLDPYTLSDDMRVPWQSVEQGDRAKILEDEFLKLICVERPSTMRRQCHFVLQHSKFTRIDPIRKQASYKVKGEAAMVWLRGFSEGSTPYEFQSADGKFRWQVRSTEVSLSFSE